MALILEIPCKEEPVSLDEMKNILSISSTTEDVLINSMITAARVQIETRLKIAIMSQTWSWYQDDFPQEFVALPIAPVTNISEFTELHEDGKYHYIPRIHRQTILSDYEAKVRLVNNHVPVSDEKFNRFRIQFTAGFRTVPEGLIDAITELVKYWYEQRGGIAMGELHQIPPNVFDLFSEFQESHHV